MKELRRNEVRSLSQDHVAIDDKAGILSQLCLPSESIFSTSTLGALTEELSLIIILTKGKKNLHCSFQRDFTESSHLDPHNSSGVWRGNQGWERRLGFVLPVESSKDLTLKWDLVFRYFLGTGLQINTQGKEKREVRVGRHKRRAWCRLNCSLGQAWGLWSRMALSEGEETMPN